MNNQPIDLTKPLHLVVEGSTAVLTLSRAPVNAIDDVLTDALEAALAELEGNDRLAILRIRSNQKVFCAGADLRMIADRFGTEEGRAAMTASVRRFHAVFDRLAALPMVTFAEIEGHALGGGLELALACDLRIAAHEAKLGLPEVNVGLIPGAGGTQRLTALCGSGIASRLILTGEVVSGLDAERLGLVQWARPSAGFSDAVGGIVERIAKLSPEALRTAKGCIRLAGALNPAGVAAEIDGIGMLMLRPETAKRVASFVAKSSG
ncbi:enoyl-CoA hydratase/isomerase family protein [Microvirga guangxiensis]|uniref:Enoyl-CoA hydratase/isomerase n=1 Tax=Microvirga guangxiensis TaxID=549386 RepID=A0A1G5F139_9HYPH|nr:enoyl-CoA hydratase/isomerase family protein [Microvirga guangxiensis]SCY32979.1 Enoyl-CoA hydratase/isomerase [Microvirga guangxiensis]